MTKTVEINGHTIHNGETLTVDHTVKIFTVTIRSMNTVSENTLKDLIETKYEVIDIKTNDVTCYVHSRNKKD